MTINNKIKSYFSFLTNGLHTMQHPRLVSDSLFFRAENGNIKKGSEFSRDRGYLTAGHSGSQIHILISNSGTLRLVFPTSSICRLLTLHFVIRKPALLLHVETVPKSVRTHEFSFGGVFHLVVCTLSLKAGTLSNPNGAVFWHCNT